MLRKTFCIMTFVLVLSLVGNALAVTMPAGEIAHYEFEGNLLDGSGNSYDGTASGFISYGTGPTGVYQTGHVDYGQALWLQGDGGVALPHAVSLDIEATGEITMAAWVQIHPSSESKQFIIGCKYFYTLENRNAAAFDLERDTAVTSYNQITQHEAPGSGEARAPLWADPGLVPEGTETKMIAGRDIADGEWHHVAATYDPDREEIRLYVDGFVAASTWAAGYIFAGMAPSGFGGLVTPSIGYSQYWNDSYLTGLIDEVRIYNRALSFQEIRTILTPEPATVMLLGLGGLALIRRKRR